MCVSVCVVGCVCAFVSIRTDVSNVSYLSLSVFKPEYESQPGRRDSELRTRVDDNKVGYKKI